MRAAAIALGIDLGTSAVKVVALDQDGHVLASGTGSFETISEQPGQAEQQPAAWLRAVEAAVGQLDGGLAAGHPRWRDRVQAIGLAGQLPTLVCMAAGEPRGTAITWKDARADAWASANIDARQRRSLYESTGMPIDGRYLGPMLRHHRAGEVQALEGILSAKDFLCHALTGVRVTDPSTAAGYGAFDLGQEAFTPALAAQWDLPMQLLPQVRPSHCSAGGLSDAGALLLGLRPGIPVSVGAADSVAGAFALAGLEEGVACVSMGSSTIIIDALRERRLDPATRYLLTPHVEPGWYGREMDLLATGTGHRWLSDLFGWQDGQLDRMAATAAAGARGLTFAPYLGGGEQGALWDPTLRGVVHGLTLQHRAPDIARAFLEGVYFEIRRCIEVLAEAAPVRAVVVSGAISELPSSMQILADVLNRPVRAAQAVSPAAEGAALGAHAMTGTRVPRLSPARSAEHAPGVDARAYETLYAGYRTIALRAGA